MSRRDLGLWPLDFDLLRHFGCHAVKLRTKFAQNRIIRGWVIDDLARFRRAVLGDGSELRAFSGVRGLNFTKLGQDIGRSLHI